MEIIKIIHKPYKSLEQPGLKVLLDGLARD